MKEHLEELLSQSLLHLQRDGVLPGDTEERKRQVGKADEEEQELDRVLSGGEDPEDPQGNSSAS